MGKAAVFGRWSAGSEAIHFTNGSISSAIGRLTSNTLWSAWLDGVSKTGGAPPAPSTIAMRNRAATDDAGVVSSEENGPTASCTWSSPNSVWQFVTTWVGELLSF